MLLRRDDSDLDVIRRQAASLDLRRRIDELHDQHAKEVWDEPSANEYKSLGMLAVLMAILGGVAFLCGIIQTDSRYIFSSVMFGISAVLFSLSSRWEMDRFRQSHLEWEQHLQKFGSVVSEHWNELCQLNTRQ